MQREVYGDAQQARAYDQRQDVNLSEHRYAGRGACGQSGDGRQKGQQCACATQREQQHQNDANERGCANTAAFMGRLLAALGRVQGAARGQQAACFLARHRIGLAQRSGDARADVCVEGASS